MPEKPQAPMLLAATATSIELQFFKPVDNGGAEVTLYELYINDGTDGEPATLVTAYSDNQMSFIVDAAANGLTTGRVYKFKFRAYN